MTSATTIRFRKKELLVALSDFRELLDLIGARGFPSTIEDFDSTKADVDREWARLRDLLKKGAKR